MRAAAAEARRPRRRPTGPAAPRRPGVSTRPVGRCRRPPSVLRVSTDSRTASSGPSAGSSSRCGLATRMGLSTMSAAPPPSPRPAGPCRARCPPARPAPTIVRSRASASIRSVPDSAFIFAASSAGVSAQRNSRRLLRERLDRAHRPAARAPAAAVVLAGQVGVLLGAGQRELLLEDRLVQHEPRVVVAARR